MRYLITLLVLLMLFGCSRYIDSEDPDFQLPDEPPVPINLRVVHLDDGIRLSWSVADTIAGMAFRVYYSDSTQSDTTLWGGTSTFSADISGLNQGQRYYFRVASVLAGNVEGRKSGAISAQVGVLTLLINNDNKYTNSRNVTISFVVPLSTSLMQISEDIGFAGEHWRTFASSTSFELSNDDGQKVVYSRFRFSDGSETDPTVIIADSIILDTETSIDSIYYTPSGLVLARDSVINFYLVTGEEGDSAQVSFPGISNLQLNFDNIVSDVLNDKYVYSRSYTIPANVEVIDGPVTGRFTDPAGNNAAEVTASALLNISNQPTAVTLFATAETSSSIRLNWSQAIDNDFAAYHIFRDTLASVSGNSDAVTVINSRSTVTYNDSGLDDSTLYYYRIYVYDNRGLTAGSNADSAITLVNHPPAAVIPAARIQTSETDTTVLISWSVSDAIDFESYRVYWTGGGVDTTRLGIINNINEAAFTDNYPSSGQNFYRVDVYDLQGKFAESDWIGISVP